MAKRLIPRHQVGKKLLNFLESFGNAQIAGDSGVGAAMAIASGYLYNPKTKKWELSKENVKEAEGLRNNLSFISTFSPTHPATAFIDKVIVPRVISVGRKALKPTNKILEVKPNSLTFKLGKKSLQSEDFYTNITRSKSFHSDFLDGPNPLNAQNPLLIYGILEDVVPSSNSAAYMHNIDNGKEIILGTLNGMSNVAKLVQLKSPKDLILLTNRSNWKNVSVVSPQEQINIYQKQLKDIINKKSASYKKHIEILQKRIKYIQDNEKMLLQSYDKFISSGEVNNLSTDEIAKKFSMNEDIGNIIFRDIYDGHTGDQIIMNTKIGHPKSIYGVGKLRDVLKRNPLKIIIPGLLGYTINEQ